MHEGYGTHCVCVTVLATTYVYLVYTSKVRQCRVSCRLRIVWILLKTFHSGDIALFACPPNVIHHCKLEALMYMHFGL